jgi:hypothetical protein
LALHLAAQVGEVAHAGGGHVGHAVRGHDLGEVLLARGLARGVEPVRAKCGVDDDFCAPVFM